MKGSYSLLSMCRPLDFLRFSFLLNVVEMLVHFLFIIVVLFGVLGSELRTINSDRGRVKEVLTDQKPIKLTKDFFEWLRIIFSKIGDGFVAGSCSSE